MPQFQGYQPTNIAPAPIFAGAQAAGQSAMDQYGIQSANANAANAGLYGALGTAGSLGTAYLM
jgi:energy-converting hydrogenase Eha subunit A